MLANWLNRQYYHAYLATLESGIEIGQGIIVGPGNFTKRIKFGLWIDLGPGKIWQKE